ncbi:FAD-dependent oxidoreductase [Corynebacterium hansenii]|uniref:FAD-dependent oxidoreductase n=1 Tax=Corynebacterium hansenii TaxID=394964 RepID=A0ABV7ZMQ5_9CORY|nr:FAD-dependent oxidoreductase [Corynebacterium hansenii]WJY98787.1 putative oxidoreductase CzcO [Corynebacterium hansenii]
MPSPSTPSHQVIIVGGGQAGAATAHYLLRAGIDVLVLDDQEGPGGAWRHVWPSMTLFSTADFSNLPGIPMPPFDGFPPASHVIDYLRKYETRYSIPVERPVHVTRVGFRGGATDPGLSDAPSTPDPHDRRFVIHAEDRVWTADHVVAATGTWSAPFVPMRPGNFIGKQWHSAYYPGPEPFRGSRVAVVGGANSAAQIAAELTRVADVTWFTRREPRWMPDDVDGRVLFRRNRERMLAILRGEDDPGADSRLGDIVMLPEVLTARDEGRLRATPMFRSLDELGGPGGFDHLIWCTGFRPALGPVRSLLDGRRPTVPGLHLVGYGDWAGPGSATITGVGPHAKATARAIAETYGTTVR